MSADKLRVEIADIDKTGQDLPDPGRRRGQWRTAAADAAMVS